MAYAILDTLYFPIFIDLNLYVSLFLKFIVKQQVFLFTVKQAPQETQSLCVIKCSILQNSSAP